MIKSILFIIIFLLIFWGMQNIPIPMSSQGVSTLLVGIILLTAFLFADLLRKFHLPRLTGYMIMGILLGAGGLGFLTSEQIEDFHFLENLALSFIALTAGGELKFKVLKEKFKSVSYILAGQVIFIFIGVFISFILAARYFSSFSQFDGNIIIAFGLLFAGTALSTSPATTIGIITETGAKGKTTNIVLFITVLKAIVLIVLFPILITYANTIVLNKSGLDVALLVKFLLQFGSSIVTGIIFGSLIIWYLKKVKVEISIFLFAVALAISEISPLFGLDILLTSIITGIVVQNFSSQGNSLISGIEIFSLPIYVLFFCLAGASLQLELLSEALALTIFLVTIRFIFNFLGNYFGAVMAQEDKVIRNFSWLGYIGQAGIALGLGIIIKQALSESYGNLFLTILISTVVINEMLGPILLKWTFFKAKETE